MCEAWELLSMIDVLAVGLVYLVVFIAFPLILWYNP